ncbi:MAG: thiamine diphosphokinase [Streptococcaceae bacterium]|nr:thiamine diphosphokinase [Streptococcaceae bacterium]
MNAECEKTVNVLIVAGLADVDAVATTDFDAVIGVDAGALWALEHGLPLDLAVGDFDSITLEDLRRIERSGATIHKLKPEKDETDFEVALRLAIEAFPEAKFTVIGALGGRLDHELTNVFLPLTPKFAEFAERIRLVNAQNCVQYLTRAGRRILTGQNGMKYVGFYKRDALDFSISEAKYPLSAEANFADIYASNEFVKETMTVAFSSGSVIVIYSNDKK